MKTDFAMNRLRMHAWFVSLLTMSAAALSGTVDLAEVVERPHRFIDVRRTYSVSDMGQPHPFLFVAQKITNTGAWHLSLKLVNGSDKMSCGAEFSTMATDDLLLSYVDRFRIDVPDANVSAISIEFMANNSVWSEFSEEMTAGVKRMRGVVRAKDPQFQAATRKFLQRSGLVREIGRKLADRFDREVKAITLASDGVAFHPECYGKEWPALADLADLGVTSSTLSMAISFK